MFLVILALSAIVISVQGQTDQSTTSTTSASTAIKTLYEVHPDVDGGKAHVKIDKETNDLNEYAYQITIEDSDVSSPSQVGFIPKDISVTFSADDNVYIIYSKMKIKYLTYDGSTGKFNPVEYNPNPCINKATELTKSILASFPYFGVYYGIYDILSSGGDMFACMSASTGYAWWGSCIVNGDTVLSQVDHKDSRVGNGIIEEIRGSTDDEKNSRRLETIAYSENTLSKSNSLPIKSVTFTIPIRSKNSGNDGHIRMWIDASGSVLLNPEPGAGFEHESPRGLALYFRNDNVFQKEAQTNENEVKFPDPNLEAAIRAAINKPEGAIYPADLDGLKSLNPSGKNIKDIAGLEYCSNLEVLYLVSRQLSSVG